LITQGLTNQQIADRIFVSVNTVKSAITLRTIDPALLKRPPPQAT